MQIYDNEAAFDEYEAEQERYSRLRKRRAREEMLADMEVDDERESY